MATIKKVIRMVNKGAAADIEVQLDHGGESSLWVGGEVIEIYHAGKSKCYLVPPWARPNQSRKGIDIVKAKE